MTDELLIPTKASEWIVLLHDDPDNLSLQRDFQSWLESDVKHREDWQNVSQTWRLLGEVGPLEGQSLPLSSAFPKSFDEDKSKSKKRDLDRTLSSFSSGKSSFLPKSSFTQRASRITGLLVLLLVIGFSLPKFSTQVKYLGADFVNSEAKAAVIDLADGSQVTLAPETAIDVQLSQKERRVTILSGVAFFDVHKDKTRPFTVVKNDIQTTVLGTAFLVDEQQDRVSVAVTEGVVRVNRLKQDGVSLQLRPGEGVDFFNARDYKLSNRPVDDIASWRMGYLKVRDQSLGSVVGQIDRFFNGHIFIPDTDVRKKRLTGVFKLEQPHKSLRGIASIHGLEVTEISPWIIILSKK
ncbi:FecR family protein [Kiloniella litopenaei]|uniref:FecR family protein n=1 Tax=Kiloniella litopenaei TaxID=1549748 RepID=UPI003BA9CD5C